MSKRFGDVTAVDDVHIELEEGHFTTLVGPSGCGKTTLLRMVAGLETPTSGEIEIHGRTVFSAGKVDLAPHQRKIGMVFQSYALWPHMTVFDNVAFPLRRSTPDGTKARRRKSPELRESVLRSLRLVDCEKLSDRYPAELSGGQQQRVAVARAIVGTPPVVLMDEPLSNLDARLRARLRFELREIQQEMGFTALYVTHDRAEALSMSDNVVMLRSGHIDQMGSPHEVYRTPRTLYGATFLRDDNRAVGVVDAVDGDTVVVRSELGRIRLDRRESARVAVGAEVEVAIARDAIDIESTDARNAEGGARVVGTAYHGWYSEVLLKTNSGGEITVRVPADDEYAAGTTVRLTVSHGALALPLGDGDPPSAPELDELPEPAYEGGAVR